MDEQAQTLNQALLSAISLYANQNCLQVKKNRIYKTITYHQFEQQVYQIMKYLKQQGITNGERMALVAENCMEWLVLYIACQLAGGVVVPLRTSLAPNTLHFILQDCAVRLAVLQDPNHINTIATALDESNFSQLSNLQAVITLGSTEDYHAKMVTMPAARRSCGSLTTAEQQALHQAAHAVPPEANSVIHYVTGESGSPKGAMFTQAQQLASLRHMAAWFLFEEDDKAFTMLSWSESLSLMAGLHYFVNGICNILAESYEAMAENMRQTSPTIMLSNPFTYEKLYNAYLDWINNQPHSNREVFSWALTKGKAYHTAGDDLTPELRQEYARANMTFFSQMRGSIGGRFRVFYSAGAPLPQQLAEFFEAIGIPIRNLYSLTEAGGFPAVRNVDLYHPASCGEAAPMFEVRIAKDKEILVRGPTVMVKYWRRPKETEQVIDAEGWLHSNDLGHFDEQNFLHVTDRKQHLMVLSNGRKIAPLAIENALVASPYIAQAAVFGHGKQYVSAMVVLDLSQVAAYFEDDGDPVTTTSHPRVKALLEELIGEVNEELDRWEQIREYSLLDQPLRQDTGELTSSMKISRHVVAERHAAQIEAMYPMILQMKTQPVTQVEVEPERLRDLLEKETILDAWMVDAGIEFLFDLARDKQIDAPSMVHISDIAVAIAQMESEEKPLSTALIVGNPARIARVLPLSQVQLLQNDHIRRMRKMLVSMAKLVDGLVLGYVIDRHGYVRGIRRLEVDLTHHGVMLLGPQFRHHAAISRQCNAVVFFVPTGGRQVRVFANGQLVGRYANGDWTPDNIAHVDTIIASLAKRKAYEPALIQRILRCAFQMSEKNLGAIFLIGDADLILQHSDNAEISTFANIGRAALSDLSDRELITFAKQDGATVIDAGSGQFRGCMILLRPGADTQAEIGPGKGARHSSAAKMSTEVNCLAITVSQDGPITIYDSGRRVLSV